MLAVCVLKNSVSVVIAGAPIALWSCNKKCGLNSRLSFDNHAIHICRACYSSTSEDCVVFALLCRRILRDSRDHDLTTAMHYLQAWRNLTWTGCSGYKTPSLVSSQDCVKAITSHQPCSRHWLPPIRARVTAQDCNIGVQSRRKSSTVLPLISNCVPARTLRSSTSNFLVEPSYRTKIGRRSFRYVAPNI